MFMKNETENYGIKITSIPSELINHPHWVRWKIERGKKVPINPETGGNASVKLPQTWADFDYTMSSALLAFDENALEESKNGIGLILTEQDDLIAFDFDHVIKDDVIEPWVLQFCDYAKSYVEISPSGDGVRIICKGKLPEDHKCLVSIFLDHNNKWLRSDDLCEVSREVKFELYSVNRFVTITGNRLKEYPNIVNDIQSFIDEHLIGFVTISPRKKSNSSKSRTVSGKPDAKNDSIDLIQVMQACKYLSNHKYAYNDWFRCGCALYNEFGENGYQYWLVLSINENYPNDTELLIKDQWNKIAQNEKAGVNIGTLFHIAKELGLRYKNPSNINILNFPCTDIGNVELFLEKFGEKIRYIVETSEWYEDIGSRFIQTPERNIHKLCVDVVRERRDLSDDIQDSAVKNDYLKFAKQSENATRLRALIGLLKYSDPVSTDESDWDNDDNLIQFTNGVYNLNDYTFSESSQGKQIRQCTGYAFDTEAVCPKWEQTLKDIFVDDDIIELVQIFSGISLTTDVTEQKVLWLLGNGCNGKSLVLNALNLLLGTYGETTPASSFDSSRASISNDIARFKDKRAVVSIEGGTTGRIDAERLKALSGGDSIVARKLYKDFTEFRPTAQLWFASNEMPFVKDKTDGFWRRIVPIECKVQFTKLNIDRHRIDKLKGELSGIFNWAVQGLKKWKDDGLELPKSVLDYTEELRGFSDPIYQFCSECIVEEQGPGINATELYDAYCNWHSLKYSVHSFNSSKYGIGSSNQKSFIGRVKNILPEKGKTNGRVYFRNIRLKSDKDE